MPDTLFIRHI